MEKDDSRLAEKLIDKIFDIDPVMFVAFIIVVFMGIALIVLVTRSSLITQGCIQAGYAGAEYLAEGGWRCISIGG